MATKAEDFRYWAERSAPKKAKPAARSKRQVKASSAPGASATERNAASPHNESQRAGRKAAYALEDSAGKPSRKSTRGASNRQKTDVQMRIKRRTAEVRPSLRAERGR